MGNCSCDVLDERGAGVDITFLCHLISIVAVAEDFDRPQHAVFNGIVGIS
jgi:hypothetical protein